VRNTVVRATIKVNGKPQLLGTCSPQAPELINLKFDLDDYVGGLTLRAKNGTNRHVKGVKYNVKNVFLSFLYFFAKLWRAHYWEYCRIFCTG